MINYIKTFFISLVIIAVICFYRTASAQELYVPMPYIPEGEVTLSLSVVSYELANSYKIKADELFLQDDFYYAKQNYLKAKEILEDSKRFRSDVFDNSNYVTGSAVSMDPGKYKQISRLYRNLLTKDIEYRLSLLEASEDFYGIEFSQNVPVID